MKKLICGLSVLGFAYAALMAFVLWYGAMGWAKLGCGPHDAIGKLCRERVEHQFGL